MAAVDVVDSSRHTLSPLAQAPQSLTISAPTRAGRQQLVVTYQGRRLAALGRLTVSGIDRAVILSRKPGSGRRNFSLFHELTHASLEKVDAELTKLDGCAESQILLADNKCEGKIEASLAMLKFMQPRCTAQQPRVSPMLDVAEQWGSDAGERAWPSYGLTLNRVLGKRPLFNPSSNTPCLQRGVGRLQVPARLTRDVLATIRRFLCGVLATLRFWFGVWTSALSYATELPILVLLLVAVCLRYGHRSDESPHHRFLLRHRHLPLVGRG